MSLNGHAERVKDRVGASCDNTDGGWVKLWDQWGGCCVLSSGIPHADLDMTFVRFYKEEVYTRSLGELVNSLDCSLDYPDTHVDLVAFRWQYDRLWFIDKNRYWSRDINF